ncbi:hypothetical protein ANCCAN_14429 [Ancylostoma caninum]|uniref:Uncharacterized protein n=1 Tax=Ancylostoma caninum TaxID=29170 RepID=A0A368GA74_ANCCA|nr:hypothetical protein ANCCAN_14429 [Ancylostoma caninum]
MSKTLFEDKWCKVTNENLIIKCYYFPIGTSKTVHVKTIRGVFYVAQNMHDQCFKVKGWGMSFSPCWWACDLRRCWHDSSGPVHYNVVIDCGETFYKGFTVIEIDDFLSKLRLVAPEAVFVPELPF